MRSVYIDRVIPSVYTDRIADTIYAVGNYYRQQRVCWYRPKKLETKLYLSVKITDKIIPSVIPLVFTDFLVVLV